MAIPANYQGTGSQVSDLLTPEVLGAYIDLKVMDAIKLTPFLDIDRTLEGRSGDTVTLPVYSYIGKAEDYAEGEEIRLRKIEADTVNVTIKKIGVGIELTDEAIMVHHGDIVNEAGKQLLMSIAEKIEEDCFTTLREGAELVLNKKKEAIKLPKINTAKYTGEFKKEAILDAQLAFGEDLDGQQILFVNPADFNRLRKDADFVHIEAGARIVSGHYGRVYGVDIIVSNRVEEDEAFLMKPGALGMMMKRQCRCEQDRNILNLTNQYTAHEFYLTYIKHADRVVRISKEA